MKYYIGLDAHCKTSTFAVVNETGQCVLRETVETTENQLSSVIKKVRGEKHLTLEESTISKWMYLHLKDKVDFLLICNPTYVAKKSGAKTDFRDALHLAQELRTGHLQAVFHDDSHWSQLRISVSSYLSLVSEIVRFKNRLKAIFRSEVLSVEGVNFYKNKSRSSELKNPTAKFSADRLFAQVEFLESEKLKFKQLFIENKKKYQPIRNLMTIPGVSIIRANIIASIVCQPARFKNKHKFWGYCMLVRHIQQSGGRIYGNKRFFGRSELRDVFMGAAESALRTETRLRDHYEALREKGLKHKEEAKINLARQIASISLCILKNNSTYNDNYQESLKKERKKTRINFKQ